jgi:hypothetical protein
MIPPEWLMRMAVWARRPPSRAQVRVALLILSICAAFVLWEVFFGWPEWLTPERGVGRRGVAITPM